MPQIEANGQHFHVQLLGAGAPAVMIHGLFVGNLASWYLTAAPALARTHRVLLYDLRGHGRSSRPATGYGLKSMTDDLLALSPQLPPGPLTLVGHSYGALIALRFACLYPERVCRLALVEAPLPPLQGGDFEEFLARNPEEMAEALPAPVQRFLHGGGRQALRLLQSLEFLTSQSSLLKDLRAEVPLRPADLSPVRCPVLCLYGDRSACLSHGEWLAGTLPNARLIRLAGGHYLHLDAPQPLTEHLAAFVQEGEAEPPAISGQARENGESGCKT